MFSRRARCRTGWCAGFQSRSRSINRTDPKLKHRGIPQFSGFSQPSGMRFFRLHAEIAEVETPVCSERVICEMCFESIISNILCVIVININPLFVLNQLKPTQISSFS